MWEGIKIVNHKVPYVFPGELQALQKIDNSAAFSKERKMKSPSSFYEASIITSQVQSEEDHTLPLPTFHLIKSVLLVITDVKILNKILNSGLH